MQRDQYVDQYHVISKKTERELKKIIKKKNYLYSILAK